MERRERRTETVIYSTGTVLVVLLILYFGLRITVLRPVQVIGRAAEAIGRGQLERAVEVGTGDEMGRLASSINDMSAGLRQRLALSKFVSGETLRAVERDSDVARGGKRARMTVLFSDIRGFTSFSESREPEEVVDMLNTWLQTQADQIREHGGDIDKFVGDELMARFAGPGHEGRALDAAVAIVEAVEALNADEHERGYHVAVGVGVNTGEVVIGAMGAEQRMDYTVIGDAVNLAARLCSAAKPGQVITSTETWQAAQATLDTVTGEALEPIVVKGKAAPIDVWRVTRRADAG